MKLLLVSNKKLFFCYLFLIIIATSIFGLNINALATVPDGERGDALYRDGVGPGGVLWHTGILYRYLTLFEDYFVIHADGVEVAVARFEDSNTSTRDFMLDSGNIYKGARTHQSGISKQMREDIVYYAEWQIGSAYSFWGYNNPASSFQKGDGEFRCDGLVENAYEYVNRDIVTGDSPLTNSPNIQYNNLVATSINYPNSTHSVSGTSGNNGWYKSNVTLEINGTDASSEPCWLKYRIRPSSYQTYTGSVILTTTSEIDYYAIDYVGNLEPDISYIYIKIDKAIPNNPNYPCNAWKTSSKTTSIPNNTTQTTTANPYFEWSGASDATSGVSGYSVYYGTSSSEEPGTTQEQTNASYDGGADPGSAGTYYLRVRTFDYAGNYSSPATLFIVKYSAPPVNHSPVLSSPELTPASGNTSTTFHYYVNYYDQDNNPPSTKYVYINGSPYTMSKTSGSAHDGTYHYSTTLPAGSHSYYFYFTDGAGGSNRLPNSGTYSGPSVSENYVTITVTTNIGSGTTVKVDSINRDASYNTNWLSGSSHILGIDSPQDVSSVKRYVFSSWSDGGAQSHTVSPTSNSTYTANLITQWKPSITLSGTDSNHTVSVTYTQNGIEHTDSGKYTSWSDWCDDGSILSFSQTTTGTPSKKTTDTRSWTVNSAFSASIQYKEQDFAFDPSPSPLSRTICQGEEANYTIKVKSIGGFNSQVSLSTGVSPEPSSGSINRVIDSPVTPTAISKLTVTAADDVTPGTYTLKITGTGEGKEHSTSVELIIEKALSITTSSLVNGRAGKSYIQALAASGGKEPYSWSIKSGSLPDGLVLYVLTGVISGTPTTKGYYTFTLQVKDSSTPVKSGTRDFSMIVWPYPSEAFGEGVKFEVTNSSIDGSGFVLLFKDGYKEVYGFGNTPTNNTALSRVFNFFALPLVKFPITVDDSWQVSGNTTYDGYPVKVTYKVLSTNDKVTVAAGTFEQCVKIEEKISFISSQPGYALINKIERWFAPKAGIVKCILYWTDGSINTGTLQSYSLNPPKNKDYFPLKKDYSWTFKWDKYTFLGEITETYKITTFDSYNNTDKFKKPYVNMDTDELCPHSNRGIDKNNERVPKDTSIIARIKAHLGIDEDSLIMKIKPSGASFYQINPEVKQTGLGKADDYWLIYKNPKGTSTGLTATILTDSTANWVEDSLIGMVLNPNTSQNSTFKMIDNTSTSITVEGNMTGVAKAGDNYQVYFDFGKTIHIFLDAKDVSGNSMTPYQYVFKTETQKQHDDAQQNMPDTTLDKTNPNKYELSANSGTELKGAKIRYDPDEAVTPRFGPLNEVPKLDVDNVNAVGLPVNLEPPVVFENPVTIFIPCPGATDLSSLEVYYYNSNPDVGWKAASEVDGWMVPNSRVNHPETSPPTIELQVYHFSGAQAGKGNPDPPSGGGGSSSGGDGGKSGGGGSCFIATAAYGTSLSKEIEILCQFRDRYLFTNSFGKKFIQAYYKLGPPIARYISDKPHLKAAVRKILKPVVKLCKLILKTRDE